MKPKTWTEYQDTLNRRQAFRSHVIAVTVRVMLFVGLVVGIVFLGFAFGGCADTVPVELRNEAAPPAAQVDGGELAQSPDMTPTHCWKGVASDTYCASGFRDCVVCIGAQWQCGECIPVPGEVAK